MRGRRTRGAPALRKRPHKSSATEIVDATLVAAALLLERDGIDGLTTNAVARVAGVSVGSLYQYFPDKLAIVAELARRIEATAIALMTQESVALRDAGARDATARVTRLSCAPGFGTDEVRRTLLREVPRGWTLQEGRSTDALLTKAITAYLSMRATQLRPMAIERAVFVAQHAVEGVGEAVLLSSPEALSSAPVQRELFRLAWADLAPEGSSMELPAIDESDVPPLRKEPDAETAQRLLEEPPHRRVVRAPPAATSEQGLLAREKIVAAVRRVIERDGFDRLTVRTVAGEAGVAIGTFYHHFANIRGATTEVLTAIEAQVSTELGVRLATASDVREVVDAVVDTYTSHTLADRIYPTLLAQVARRWSEDAVTGLRTEAQQQLSVALARTCEAPDHGLRAFFVLHAVRTVIEAFVLLEPPELTTAELSTELKELATRYLVL